MSGSLGTPFDVGNADAQQPGFLGQSPDFWRQLMAFGANLSQGANARTATGHLANGAGFAGPLGAAISSTMTDMQKLAQVRSQLGLQRQQTALTQAHIPGVKAQADKTRMETDLLGTQMGVAPAQVDLTKTETAGKVIQNAAAGSALGPQLLTDQARTNMLQDYLRANGGGTQFQFSPADRQTYLQGINRGEGTAQNPRSTAVGFGQFIDDTWRDFAKANPQHFQGMDDKQILAQKTNRPLAEQATEWLAKQNAPVLVQAGIVPNNPALGLAHMMGAKSAIAVLKADPNTPVPTVLAGVLDPPKLAAQLKANPTWAGMTAGQIAGQRASMFNQSGPRVANTQPPYQQTSQQPQAAPQQPQTPFSVGAPQQAPPQAAPQQQTAPTQGLGGRPGPDAALMQQADALNARATRMDAAQKMGMGFAEPGDPAALRAQALDFQKRAHAAQEEWDKANAKPMDVRQGSVLYQGGQIVGAAPIEKPVVGPDNRTYTATYYPVPPPNFKTPDGIPPWAPPGTMALTLAARSPEEQEYEKARVQQTTKDMDQDRTEVAKVLDAGEVAQQKMQTLFSLRDIAKRADSGSGAEMRQGIRAFFQTYAPNLAPKLLGDAVPLQEFLKHSLLLTGQMDRQFFGSNAGVQAAEMFLKANPNLGNLPETNVHMANAFLLQSQRALDYAHGLQDHYNGQSDAFHAASGQQAPPRWVPASKYQSAFQQMFKPELYAAAIEAANGKQFGDWGKGLTNQQQRVVSGILQRFDPSTVIDWKGKQVPVRDIQSILSPNNVMSPPAEVPSNGG